MRNTDQKDSESLKSFKRALFSRLFNLVFKFTLVQLIVFLVVVYLNREWFQDQKHSMLWIAIILLFNAGSYSVGYLKGYRSALFDLIYAADIISLRKLNNKDDKMSGGEHRDEE